MNSRTDERINITLDTSNPPEIQKAHPLAYQSDNANPRWLYFNIILSSSISAELSSGFSATFALSSMLLITADANVQSTIKPKFNVFLYGFTRTLTKVCSQSCYARINKRQFHDLKSLNSFLLTSKK